VPITLVSNKAVSPPQKIQTKVGGPLEYTNIDIEYTGTTTPPSDNDLALGNNATISVNPSVVAVETYYLVHFNQETGSQIGFFEAVIWDDNIPTNILHHFSFLLNPVNRETYLKMIVNEASGQLDIISRLSSSIALKLFAGPGELVDFLPQPKPL